MYRPLISCMPEVSFFWKRRCFIPGWLARVSRSSWHGSWAGSLVRSFIRTGYHTCVGKSGTMSTPARLSVRTFCSTLGIMLKGGKAQKLSSLQERAEVSRRAPLDQLCKPCSVRAAFEASRRTGLQLREPLQKCERHSCSHTSFSTANCRLADVTSSQDSE